MPKNIKSIIHTASTWALELIIPRKCAGCGQEKEVFCQNCENTSYKKGAQCLFCGFRNSTGKFCPECRSPSLMEVRLPSNFNQVLWAGKYDGPLRKAVLGLKYGKRKELATELGKIIYRKFIEINPAFEKENFLVVPIPLHFKKEHERGFNQAELIAKEFSKLSGIKLLIGALIKTKETPAQVEVKIKEERVKNLENAFLFKPPPDPLPTIILIDDVATTGATLIHASRALAYAEATKVIGLVVAHGN